MEKNFQREFDKCPNCGSEDRFLEQLGNELKERGLAREEWDFCMDSRQGVVADKAKQGAIPIGSELPLYALRTDICMDCGLLYATKIARGEGKVGLPPPQLLVPNRADRRRDARQN